MLPSLTARLPDSTGIVILAMTHMTLVFPSLVGTFADASHIRRSFRKVVAAAGLDPHQWTPRELRHSFGTGGLFVPN
jgi:hypothetical protein